MISSNKLALGLILTSMFIGLISSALVSPDRLAISNEDLESVNNQTTSEVSPTGIKLENKSQYRFAEYDNSLLYGPYLVDESKYYYQKGQVLNNRLKPVSNTKVEGLHNFYLKTYLDPLFYSPTNSKDLNLSDFEKFEEQKILSEYCGLEYDLIPGIYFENLEQNQKTTERFLKYASERNADRVLSQNLNTTESYSEYVTNFIDLINRDVSGNECFANDTENYGLAKATRTPVQYRLDSQVLLNYSSMANDNIEALVGEIEYREKILKSENETNLTIGRLELENYSYSYESVFGPQKAKEEMNERRIDEITSLAEATDEDAYEETQEDEDNQEEQTHKHGEETHTHEDEKTPDDTEKEVSGPVELTLNQWRDVRLVEEVPVQYDLKPSCLERNSIPVYGWDKNIYPNIMLGEDTLFKDRPKYLRELFTLSRCPYVELTRLNWYVTDGLYRDISQEPINTNYEGPRSIQVTEAERIFLEDPGDETLSQLSKVYKMALKDNLNSDKFSQELPIFWRRSLQESSRLHKFEPTYDDFYNDKHMRVWDKYFPQPGPRSDASVYNNFLLLESTYALTFMTWSDSVWRLDEKPEKFAGKLG